MDKIKPITKDEFNVLAAKLGFNLELLIKDYYLTLLLFHLSKVKGLYFKGGTALNKLYLSNPRLSEDIDFTVKGKLKDIEKQIRKIVSIMPDFNKVTHDKKVSHFTRLIVHYSKEDIKGSIIIDLNSKAKLLLKPEIKDFKHFYPEFIPKFTVATLNSKELIAEKICALIQRYAPRDYYDVYNIINEKLPIDIKLIKKKFKASNEEYSVERIFKRGSKIYSKWESDLLPLTRTKPSFQEVISVLAKYFKYKEKKPKKT